ncbi:MAG: hypothetical protein VX958_04240 [Planctomycetota bacterium]|nr:hypothetical protein [Planctomycetota bacterium]
MLHIRFHRTLNTTAFLAVLLPGLLVGGPLFSQAGTRLFVWVRPANDADLRLSKSSAPNLRKLARCGAALPRLSSLTADALAAEMRKSGGLLPQGKFSELGQKAAAKTAPAAGSALARLREKFGKSKPEATKPSQTSAATPQLVNKIFSSFDKGARLVFKTEPSMTATADHCRELDKRIGEMVSQFDLEKSGGDIALLVVLVPASGQPAMIAAGNGFKRAKICKGSPGAAAIAAGITGLVDPGSKSAADWSWILNILEQSTAKALQGRRSS